MKSTVCLWSCSWKIRLKIILLLRWISFSSNPNLGSKTNAKNQIQTGMDPLRTAGKLPGSSSQASWREKKKKKERNKKETIKIKRKIFSSWKCINEIWGLNNFHSAKRKRKRIPIFCFSVFSYNLAREAFPVKWMGHSFSQKTAENHHSNRLKYTDGVSLGGFSAFVWHCY